MPTEPLEPDCHRNGGDACVGAPMMATTAPARDAGAVPAAPDKRLAFGPDAGRDAPLTEGRSMVTSEGGMSPLPQSPVPISPVSVPPVDGRDAAVMRHPNHGHRLRHAAP